MTRKIALLVAAVLGAAAGACSKAPAACSAANCQGCCDATGLCRVLADATCGINGAVCQACVAGDVCDQGLCVPGVGTATTGSNGTTGSGGVTSTGGSTGGVTFGTVASSSSSSSSWITASSSGSGTSGSTGSASGSSSGSTGNPNPDAGFIIYPDGGGFCDFGAPIGGSCSPECLAGFHCEGGQCVLNGNTGPLEVTLRWGLHVDLDLHVVEPGGCEVYYGNRNCTAGSRDLDSNAACSFDFPDGGGVDTENVIFVDGGPTPPSGAYIVRVDDYEQCDPPGQIVMPYEVIVRVNGVTSTYCGTFQPNTPQEGDGAGAGGGTTVTTFNYP